MNMHYNITLNKKIIEEYKKKLNEKGMKFSTRINLIIKKDLEELKNDEENE